MKLLTLVPYYLSWHYTQGVKDLLNLWKTFLWFLPNFFSIGTLLKTLFSPFQRLNENYRGGLDIENFFSTLIVNTLMRLVGFIIRSMLIVIGILAFALTLLLGLFVFLGWLLLPILIVFLFFISLKSLFTNYAI